MNIQALMTQVNKMKKEISKKQSELETKTYEGSASNALVIVKLKGDYTLEEITIAKELEGDNEMIQDLLVIAYNDAKSKLEKDKEETLGKLTGGMSIPGLF